MNIRARFEEIWPVPDGVYWHVDIGYYTGLYPECMEQQTRLETFTRCQETTDVYVSLVKELIDELECMTATFYTPSSDEVLDRAKQIMEQKK